MNSPKVSIGLPVFNGAKYLRCSIESLLDQDYEDIELIISDNASTDETKDICLEAVQSDRRVRYYRNEVNLGASRNFNKVFEVAKGEYFKWAAHDDECHPSMIRRCVEFLDQTPDSVTMVYPLAELIDEEGNVLKTVLDRIEARNPSPHRRLAQVLWSLNMCDPVFGLYKSRYLKQTQLIGPFFGADFVLLGELAMLGEIREMNEVLFRLRAHTSRSMQANPNTRARAAWYDPASARKLFVLPEWERMVLEMMKSARNADLPTSEKMKCLAAIPAVHYWHRFKVAGGLAKMRLKAALGVDGKSG